MKDSEKTLLIILTIFRMIIILMVVTALINNPILLFRTDEGIRRHLLRVTPIGTSMEDVIRIFDDNIRFINKDLGVALMPTSTQRPSPTEIGYYDPRFPIVGEQSIRIRLGTLNFILSWYIEAFYAFDSDGNLIEIFTRRLLAL